METNYDLIVNSDGTLYNPPSPEGLAKEYYDLIEKYNICTKTDDPNYFGYKCMHCNGCSRGEHYVKPEIPDQYKEAVLKYRSRSRSRRQAWLCPCWGRCRLR